MIIKGIKVVALSIILSIVPIIYNQSIAQEAQTTQDQTTQDQSVSGNATYFEGVGQMGSCGSPIPELGVALNPLLVDESHLCGRKVQVTRDGKTIVVPVVDRCFACETTDIDLTPKAFAKLSPLSVGKIHVTWKVLSK